MISPNARLPVSCQLRSWHVILVQNLIFFEMKKKKKKLLFCHTCRVCHISVSPSLRATRNCVLVRCRARKRRKAAKYNIAIFGWVPDPGTAKKLGHFFFSFFFPSRCPLGEGERKAVGGWTSLTELTEGQRLVSCCFLNIFIRGENTGVLKTKDRWPWPKPTTTWRSSLSSSRSSQLPRPSFSLPPRRALPFRLVR